MSESKPEPKRPSEAEDKPKPKERKDEETKGYRFDDFALI